ncbi:hypothetical protein FKP32DRAFT_1596781 [Trametes sanguinea]|nr:hypothetical protein FKP32DRAFT_1596781 [Trametes sanguinea]
MRRPARWWHNQTHSCAAFLWWTLRAATDARVIVWAVGGALFHCIVARCDADPEGAEDRTTLLLRARSRRRCTLINGPLPGRLICGGQLKPRCRASTQSPTRCVMPLFKPYDTAHCLFEPSRLPHMLGAAPTQAFAHHDPGGRCM